MILFLLLIVVAAVVLYILYTQGRLGTGDKDPLNIFKKKETPREVLDRRFASGEIGEEEYRRMKKALDE
jgi:putative membrane protein